MTRKEIEEYRDSAKACSCAECEVLAVVCAMLIRCLDANERLEIKVSLLSHYNGYSPSELEAQVDIELAEKKRWAALVAESEGKNEPT